MPLRQRWIEKERRTRAHVRLRATGQKPMLSLYPGHRYHLFLSHCWTTGQDQTHTIKAKAKEMLPDVKIFLDVDDLESIDALEEHIIETALVLLFVSRGFFKSENCRREYDTCLQLQKQRVVVYETETHKGGGTFAEICQLCPEGKREAFFNGARAVLPFSRLFEFQRVLLCQLLSHMLLATPRYADDAMPETAEHTLMSLASSLSPRKASKSLAQLSSQLSSHGLGCCAASGSAESGAADEAGAAEAAVIEVAVIGPQRDWLRAAEVTISSS